MIKISNDIRTVEAFKSIAYTNKSAFITGNFSSGKSTLKQAIINLSNKKYLELAPNELEAIKNEEVSFQSFFKIDKLVMDDDLTLYKELEYSKHQINFIKELELIIIDEISVFTSKNLDMMDMILQRVRGNNMPMGGIQLLIVGDLFNSSPCLSNKELKEIKKRWKSQYFFDAKCYESLEIETHYLNQSFLAPIEYYYTDFLDLLKQNRLKSDFLHDFNTMHFHDENSNTNNEVLLTLTHEEAEKINKNKSSKLKGRTFSSYATIEGNFNTELLQVKPIILAKENEQVILLKNKNDRFDSYHNGTVGVLKSIHMEFLEIETERYGSLRINKKEWKNYQYKYDKDSKEFKKVVVGVFYQFPVISGWAISIDDSKGMVFNKVYLENTSLLKKEHAYRAYSRATGISAFAMKNVLSEENVNTNSLKQKFYREKVFQPVYGNLVD